MPIRTGVYRTVTARYPGAMSDYLESRQQLKRDTAIRYLSRMEVGETLEIADLELKLYQWARDQLGDRTFEGVKQRDQYRAWYVITRVG